MPVWNLFTHTNLWLTFGDMIFMRTWLKCQIWYLLLWTKYVKCPSLPFSIYLVKLSTSVRVMKTTTKKPFIPILFVSSTWALWVEHSTQVLQKKKQKQEEGVKNVVWYNAEKKEHHLPYQHPWNVGIPDPKAECSHPSVHFWDGCGERWLSFILINF